MTSAGPAKLFSTGFRRDIGGPSPPPPLTRTF